MFVDMTYFVSTSPLCGYFNFIMYALIIISYRLHPESELPDWYSAVDDNESKRRWR